MASRKSPKKTRIGTFSASQSRLGNQSAYRRPLSEAEEKARTLVAKMENRLRKMVRRNARKGPSVRPRVNLP